MLRSPILWKLFGSYIALAAVCLIGAGVATQRILVRSAEHEIERGLLERAQTLSPILEPVVAGPAGDLESRVRELAREIDDRITIVRADGVVLADSAGASRDAGTPSDWPEFGDARAGRIGTAIRRGAADDRSFLYVAVPMGAAQPKAAVLRLAAPNEPLVSSGAYLRDVVLQSAALGLLGAIVFGFFVARRLTKPLRNMTQVARRYATGDFQPRVHTPAHDEIGDLGRGLNAMGEDLQRKIKTIEQDREETRTLLSAMIEGVIAVDRAGRIFLVNEAAKKIFGLESAEQKPLIEALRNSQVQRAVGETLATERHSAFEVELLDGSNRVLEAQAAPILGSRGGCVIVFHDISRLRKLENMRRDFVANVSHELRTPLTSIKGYVETLLAGALDDPKNNLEFLKKVSANADRLHALITDLLSLSRLEGQEQPYTLVPLELRTVVERSIAAFRDRATAKRMTIVLEGALDGLRVLGDESGLAQVLDNLIDNAIKYTPEGGRVTIETSADASRVRVAVQDSGVGIPSKDLPRIFERFYRVDRARSRELGGTGLGLAIVKHVVQALRGTIDVTSELGRGSRFVVTLGRADAPN